METTSGKVTLQFISQLGLIFLKKSVFSQEQLIFKKWALFSKKILREKSANLKPKYYRTHNNESAYFAQDFDVRFLYTFELLKEYLTFF